MDDISSRKQTDCSFLCKCIQNADRASYVKINIIARNRDCIKLQGAD